MITALYAALLGILFVVLSFNVIAKRRKYQVALGDKGEKTLQRAIRVHGNFAEYVPFALLLMFLSEYSGLAQPYLHALGILLLLGRLLHAWGVRQIKEKLVFRVTGMMLTQLVIVASIVAILLIYFTRIAIS